MCLKKGHTYEKNSIKKILAAGMVAVMSIGFGSIALAAYTSYNNIAPSFSQHRTMLVGTKLTSNRNAFHALESMGGEYPVLRVWIDDASYKWLGRLI